MENSHSFFMVIRGKKQLVLIATVKSVVQRLTSRNSRRAQNNEKNNNSYKALSCIRIVWSKIDKQ